MQITVTFATRRITQCGGNPKYNASGCGGEIKKAERIFKGAWWHAKRYQTKYWHFQCYVDGASFYLDTHPFVDKPTSHNGGRPKVLDLSKEQKKQRAYLAMKASKIRKEMTTTVEAELPGWMERKEDLDREYWKLGALYKECGGVPKSWI